MSSDSLQPSPFSLPQKIEALLASLARLYKAQGKDALLRIIANSKVEVDEGIWHDNWDGGQDGHRVRLSCPDSLFHEIMIGLGNYQDSIKDDLNRLANIPGESISEVSISVDLEPPPSNWRRDTGALLSAVSLASPGVGDIERLWERGRPRVFLSHRAAYKIETKCLKDELEKAGCAAFVAHEDIEPTQEWQVEIERALNSMEVLVAVLTPEFGTSYWVNQEIGVAIGRGVPVISLRIGEDPKGLIGRYQGISGAGKTERQLSQDLLGRWANDPILANLLLEGAVGQWETAKSFDEGIQVLGILEKVQVMPDGLLKRIETAVSKNDQLHNSAVVGRKYPPLLERWRAAAKKPSP